MVACVVEIETSRDIEGFNIERIDIQIDRRHVPQGFVEGVSSFEVFRINESGIDAFGFESNGAVASLLAVFFKGVIARILAIEISHARVISAECVAEMEDRFTRPGLIELEVDVAIRTEVVAERTVGDHGATFPERFGLPVIRQSGQEAQLSRGIVGAEAWLSKRRLE